MGEQVLQTAARCFLSLLRDVQTAAAGRPRPTHSLNSRRATSGQLTLEIELQDSLARRGHGGQSELECRPLLTDGTPEPPTGKQLPRLSSILR